MYYRAEDIDLIGDVVIEKDASIWFRSVLRADADQIRIGEGSNIQDGCIIHEDPGLPVMIGKHVTVGHGAILHGCRIGDETLIGMGSIVLNGAKIGKHCLIGAGALVTQGTVIPDGMMAFGSPAKVVRPLSQEEITANRETAEEYIALAERYLQAEKEDRSCR